MVSELNKFAKDIFQFRPRMSVQLWAENNIILNERITEMPGPYTTRHHPYVREPLENTRNPNVKRQILCWGSQTSKTTTYYISMGYTIDQKPVPILWVMPTSKIVSDFSKERWKPFCESTDIISKHIPRTRNGGIDEDRFTNQRQEFDRCTVQMVGGQSEANVRQFPIAHVYMDEIDVIPEEIQNEAEARIKGRSDYKIFKSSTPKTEWSGIWGEYKRGDQRKFFMPCPHCKEYIEFLWRDVKENENDETVYRIKFDEDARINDDAWNLDLVRRTAYYECQECGGDVQDGHKTKMMRDGVWKPTSQTAEPYTRSYHLNSMYSPYITFGRMMVEWLSAQNSVADLQSFINGWLAEPWRERALAAEPSQIKALEMPYIRGELKGDYRLIYADVQRAYLPFVVRGFDAKAPKSYLVEHGNVPTFEDLDDVFRNNKCKFLFMDTGFGDRTQECYEEIFKRKRTWFAAKHWEKMTLPHRINEVDPFTGDQRGRAGRYHIKLVHINNEVWKGELARCRAGKIPHWHVYQDIAPDYVKQILSEYQVDEIDRRGFKKTIWKVKSHGQNHFWDCEVGLRAFANLLGLGGVAQEQKVINTERKIARKRPPTKGRSFWDK